MTHLEFQEKLKQLKMTPRELAILSGFQWLSIKHMFYGEQVVSKRVVAFLILYETWEAHHKAWQNGDPAPDLVKQIEEAGTHNRQVVLAIRLHAPISAIDDAVGIAKTNLETRLEHEKKSQADRGRSTNRLRGAADGSILNSRTGAAEGRSDDQA